MISAVLFAWKIARIFVDKSVVSRFMRQLPDSADGPMIDKISGREESSELKTRLNCSRRDFLGSTLVGERQDSGAADLESLVKFNECFFFDPLVGTELAALNIVFFLSLVDGGFSRGGLVMLLISLVAWASPSGLLPSLPLLSARHDSFVRCSVRN